MGYTYRSVPVAKLATYRVRRCLSLHSCNLCHADIVLGQGYHDGGYGRRAHVECVAAALAKDQLPADLQGLLDRYVGNPAARNEIRDRIVEELKKVRPA